MKTTIYLCCLLGLASYSQTAQASFNHHKAPHLLIDYTKTKPVYAESKSPYTKYALVRFITDDGLTFNIDGKNGGGGSSTPNLNQTADNGCTASAYPYTTDVTAQNCQSTEQCFDGTTYRMKCTSCKNNMGLANGKCTCANAGYKYSDDNPCDPADFNLNIDKPTCSEVNNQGLTVTYYKACVCSSIYAYRCNETGQSPVGVGCGVNGDPLKYVNCSCDSKYVQTCDNGDVEPSGVGCYNTSTKKTLYMSCAPLCDIAKGQIKSWSDWWCGLCINGAGDDDKLQWDSYERFENDLNNLKSRLDSGLTQNNIEQFETDLNNLERSLPSTLDDKQRRELETLINELRKKFEQKKQELSLADPELRRAP